MALVVISIATTSAEADPSYKAAVLADTPVSYWRLGETGSNDAKDERGANSGKYQDNPTQGAASLLATDTANTAVTFNGAHGYVKVSNSSSLQLTSSISLESWIKPTSLPSSGNFTSILTKAESYSLQFNGPRLEFTIMQSGVRKRLQAPAGAIVAGQSYDVVGTYDGTTQRLYVNGTLVASTALSGPATTNTNNLYIGSWDGKAEFFNGTIDEPAVYNTALSATRIGVHYEAGSGKAPPPPSASAAVLADTPVSYWRLGEASGTSAGDERGANPGTYTNSPTLGATSLLATDTANTAVSFDGTNDYAKVNSSSSLQLTSSISLESWIKPSSIPTAGNFVSILSKEESFALQFNGPRLEFRLNQGENKKRLQAPEGAIVAGQSYYVVATYDGAAQRLYVNGTLVASTALSGSFNTNANPLDIGSWDGTREYFKGTIDDAAVYNTALSATRIGVHYEAGSGKAPPPPSAPAAVLADAPISYWRLGETSGTTAVDERGATPGTNPGTYQNSPTLGATSLLATDTANKAVSFDGVNDSVKVPNSTSLQPSSSISLEAWIKPTSLPAEGSFTSILSKTEAFALQFNGPKLELRINQGESKQRLKAPEGAIVAGQTYYVVGTYDGTAQRLYVNGTLVASTSLSGSFNTNSNAVYIGSSDGSGNLYKGTIDEPAIYNTALSATRIGVHYEAGSGKAAPPPPNTTITSPTPSYTSHEESPITFTSDKSGSTFQCSLDGSTFSTCSSPYTLPAHLSDDPNIWHTFQVVATDSEGRQDLTPAEWKFNLGIYPPAPVASKLVYPEDGKKSASYYTLKAEWGSAPWGGGVTGVSFQVKLPKWDAFKTVPPECVIDGKGKQVSWPLPAASNPGHSEPVFLKVKGCAPFEEAGYPKEEIQFRAVFDGGPNAAGASEPAATEFIYGYNGRGSSVGAVASVGPASLDLLTGAFTISRTDVSIPVPGTEANLEFTRIYHSGEYGPSFLLGPEWQPSTPAESEYEGEAWQMLAERHIPEIPAVWGEECWDEEGEPTSCNGKCEPEFCEKWLEEEAHPEERWMELLNNQGEGISFEISGGNYISPDYAKELKLTREDSTHLLLSDPNGTHTVFEEESYATYKPKTISFQATPSSVRMVYEKREHEGLVLVREIAPAPTGVTCGDWTSIEKEGCRTLKFEYKEGTPFYSWELRLESIRYYNATGNEGSSQVVAQYKYDKRARLIEEWDPRIEPNLVEKYAYYSELDFPYLLTSLTPPGEEPWEFAYKLELKGKHWEEQLTSVSRASLLKGEPTATTTIAYEVPTSGEGAPYDMSPESVAEWGQTDYPVDATTIFPPGAKAGDYSRAVVHYMDPDGYEVNTATPSPTGVEGESITTSETDTHGNVVRSLSAQSRLESLKAGDPVVRSHELDSHSIYNSEGTRMLESWEPLHKVRLESGETAEARLHTTVEYDQGAPTPKEGEAWPNLPTTETIGAAIPGKEKDAEPRVSETKYDWSLRKPIETIIDPGKESEGHLNLISKVAYNSTGQIKEERQPASEGGNDPHTTVTTYYSANNEGTCPNKPAWAGLPCAVYPASIQSGGSAGQLITRCRRRLKTGPPAPV